MTVYVNVVSSSLFYFNFYQAVCSFLMFVFSTTYSMHFFIRSFVLLGIMFYVTLKIWYFVITMIPHYALNVLLR